MESKFIQAGNLQKSFGTEGFLKFKAFPELKEQLLQSEFIWLMHDDYFVPYRVISIDGSKKMIQFDDVFDIEKATKIHNKALYVLGEHLSDSKRLETGFLQGFDLYDNDEFIAEVSETREIAGLLYGVLLINEKEVLFPIHENLLIEIDQEHRILRMDLPEGLLEI